MRSARALVAWVSRTAVFRRLAPRFLPRVERLVRLLTWGRTGAAGLIVPSLVLHSTGARSGQPRDTELMCVPEGDGWLVTGSNFGGERHPAWTYNLLAHPEVEITWKRERIPVRADPVGADEREAVWAFLEDQWPGYRGYERVSGRALRIFRLSRRRETT